MSICKTCRNHDKCKFDFKDTVNTCSFIYPEEIPIIHGKAELELHDKEIRNKTIDECVRMIEETPWKDVEMLVESIKQMKGGVE